MGPQEGTQGPHQGGADTVLSGILFMALPSIDLRSGESSLVWSGMCVIWTVPCEAPLSLRFSQARILEWVASSFSRGSSRPRDQTQVSCVPCISR